MHSFGGRRLLLSNPELGLKLHRRFEYQTQVLCEEVNDAVPSVEGSGVYGSR